MPTTINPLKLRKAFGRDHWLTPDPWGSDGWRMLSRDQLSSVIVSATSASLHPAMVAEGLDVAWIHASMAHADRVPSYDELKVLHQAVWGGRGEGWAYQLFAPPAEHVDIHPHALHLWGRVDGKPAMPNFGGIIGSI